MGRKKARKPRIGRASEQAITRRGLRIYQMGGQIKTLSGNLWDVASQSEKDVWYRVSFAVESPTCECPYHITGKGCRCKHIAAVEHNLLIMSQPIRGEEKAIEQRELSCPDCGETKYTRHGLYHGKHEARQKYKCSACGRRFRDNLGFEYRQVPSLYITLALMLSGMGISVGNIQITLKHLGVKVHPDTITRILSHYSESVQKYADTIKPAHVGDKMGCDEKRQDIRGKERWFVAVMDLTTRFVLAWDVSSTKEGYDAAPLLRRAKDMAGRIPRVFITDGLDQYHIAFKKVFYTLKGIRAIHIQDIHIRNLICNTNKQERLNGELEDHFRYARGEVGAYPCGCYISVAGPTRSVPHKCGRCYDPYFPLNEYTGATLRVDTYPYAD